MSPNTPRARRGSASVDILMLSRLLDAIAFAATAHAGQKRKGFAGAPYIVHPIAVVRALLAAGERDPDILTAGALHDVIEDCGITAEALASRFSQRVADLVVAVTDDKAITREQRDQRRLAHAPVMTRNEAVLKLADAACNITELANDPPVSWSRERIRAKANYYLTLARVLPRVNERLLRTIVESAASIPPRLYVD